MNVGTRAGIVCAWIFLSSALSASALSLANMFTDNMVLQQSAQVQVWGWAEPGERVRVVGSWAGEQVSTTADESGRWQLSLATPEADPDVPPHTLRAEGEHETIVLNDVLIGEVWVLSGQSNMEMALRGWPEADPPLLIEGAADAIATADYPHLRLFIVGRQAVKEPAADTLRNGLLGTWTPSHPDANVDDFSAVGFFFGRHLHEHLGVPVGLIQVARGGSPAEAWTPRRDLEAFDAYAEGPWEPADLTDRRTPASLYNGMIAPLMPFTMRGVLWYQGEDNVGRSEEYARLFPTLIHAWRRDWGQGDFPFYFVQIAPYAHYPARTALPELWEAQGAALYLPQTAMASALDAGNLNDIHPTIKAPLGERLARLARARTYGHEITDSGPLFSGLEKEGNTLRVSFAHVGDGLVWSAAGPVGFEVAGADLRFREATAVIEGETVIVFSDSVPDPEHVRYAWSDRPEAALYNANGFPAPPFRSNAPDYLPSIYGAPNPAFEGPLPTPVANPEPQPGPQPDALELSVPLGNHMVLQQHATALFEGRTAPRSPVTVTPSWASFPALTTADEDGFWSVELATPAAHSHPGPHRISVVAGTDAVVLEDVLLGDVWLLAGGGDLPVTLGALAGTAGADAVSDADLADIRLLNLLASGSSDNQPPHDSWQRASEAVSGFSAIGMHFAAAWQTASGTPVGVIQATDPEARLAAWLPDSESSESGADRHHRVAQASRLPVAGIIWQAGGADQPAAVATGLPSILEAWRQASGRADLPVLLLERSGRQLSDQALLALLREAEGAALDRPATVLIGTGDLHRDGVAEAFVTTADRMAHAAGRPHETNGLRATGPLFSGAQREGEQLRIFFESASNGLVLATGESTAPAFEIAAADGVFLPATVTLDGNTLLLRHPDVAAPAHARYDWGRASSGALRDAEGNAAISFRTDVPGYLKSHYGSPLPRPEWAGFAIIQEDFAFGGRLGWFEISQRPWGFSYALENWLYAPAEFDLPEEGGWVFFFRQENREPAAPADWAGYPVEDDQALTPGFLGWVSVAEEPWIYAYSLESWIYMPDLAIIPGGAWGYLLP